jgi:hypothetical protein
MQISTTRNEGIHHKWTIFEKPQGRGNIRIVQDQIAQWCEGKGI